MATSKDAVRRALEVLSHVSKEDYEGMEAEFFATVAKLSADYESHVRYSITKNYMEKYIIENIPCCPKCNTNSNVTIASPSLDLRFFAPYLDKKEEKIHMYTDTQESFLMKDYPSAQFLEFAKEVDQAFPNKSHLLGDHMFCYGCEVSFPPNDFVKNAWTKKMVFSDIVEWSKKNGKENEVE